MDTARAQLEPRRQRGPFDRLQRKLGLSLIASPTAQRIAAIGLGSIQTVRLDKLLQQAPIPESAKRVLRLLPDPQPLRFKQSAVDEHTRMLRRRVQLFTGCTGDLFDRTTINASLRLLERLGYTVDIPVAQNCCGALHLHNGEADKAAQLAQTNIAAFPGDDPVISIASGCQARLKNYATQYAGSADFSNRVTDILSLLLSHGNTGLEFKPAEETVAVHIPCTQRNALRQPETAAQVLAWIPGINVVTINPKGGCCGAAGSYMLTQPQLSKPLAQQMADAMIASGARQLVTTNIGCTLQLRAALRERNTTIDVLHPVTLIERALV